MTYSKRLKLGALFTLFLGPFLISLVSTAPGQAVDNSKAGLFVAPQGNNQWTGTLAEANKDKTNGPFATLERALQASREGTAAGRPGPVITIRGGTYILSKAVELIAADSGTVDHPLKLVAYPDEKPVFDGGINLSGTWRKQDHGPLWSIHLPDLPRPVEDLFVNGKKQPRARFPRSGFMHAIYIKNQGTRKFSFNAGELKAWPDAANGMVIIKSREWFDETLPIQSIDEKNLTVTLAKESQWSLAGDGQGRSGDYYIENIREAVDQPGAWCFDPNQRTLLFWPPVGVDPNRAGVIAGGLPLLVSVRGDVEKHQWVEHVVFDGLTFAHAGRFDTTPDLNGSAVFLGGGVRNCEVRNCLFTDVGGCGVVLWKECQNNLISKNEFTGVGETPVKITDYLGGGPPISSGNVVENNTIHHCGTVARRVSGVELDLTAHNRIAHNLIYDMPFDGITVNGERPEYWNQAASPGLKPPFRAVGIKPFVPTLGNIIEFNHIHHVMEELGDGGGIYLWGVMGSGVNIVRNNLIEHVGKGTGAYFGIYLDDYCEDVQVTDNVINDSNFGLQLHGAPRNVLENNVFAWSRQGDIFVQPEKYNTPPMRSVIRKNIFFQGAGTPFFDTSWAAWDKLPLVECDHNIYWQNGRLIQLGKGDFSGFDQHSLVTDPKFEDPEHGNFRLKQDSPASQLGIHAIDLRNVGSLSSPSSASTDKER